MFLFNYFSLPSQRRCIVGCSIILKSTVKGLMSNQVIQDDRNVRKMKNAQKRLKRLLLMFSIKTLKLYSAIKIINQMKIIITKPKHKVIQSNITLKLDNKTSYNLKFQKMCGNDISTIPVPGQDLIDLIEPQLSRGIIKIVNKQIGIPQVNAIKTLNFTNVVVLELNNCKLTADTLRQLTNLGFQNLVKLNLNNNQIGPQGCKIIAEAPVFGKLTVLQINKNGIKDEGLGYLTRGGYRDGLQDLSVNDNQVSNAGVSKLLKSFKTLHCFSAGGNTLTDQAVQQLKQNLNLEKLIFLKLSRNQITDKGLDSLLQAQNIQDLQVLLVERNNITRPKQQYKGKKSLNKDLFLFY